MAANYKVTVTYEGDNLYYAIYNTENGEWYENKGRDCFNALRTSSFDLESKYLTNYELNFYTDNQCQGRLSSGAIPLKELFPSSQQAKITVYSNGDWAFTNAANPDPQEPQNPENPQNPDNPENPGQQDPENPAKQDPQDPRYPGQQDPVPTKNGMTYIAFFPPWTNTNAQLYVNGEKAGSMLPLENFCGWFIAAIKVPTEGLNVYFERTIGGDFVGAAGLTKTEPTAESEYINLDSLVANPDIDTIWVKGNQEGIVPEIYSQRPASILGDCVPKKLPVMMFDWLHGDKSDGVRGNGNPEYGVSADFGSGGCDGRTGGSFNGSRTLDGQTYKFMEGMVEKELGPNGVPVRAADFPKECTITDHLDYWFLPESLNVDSKGNTLTNMTCRDLYLDMDKEGFWYAEISGETISKGNESNKGGMFLLDDFEFLDSGKTIRNPYFDQLEGHDYEDERRRIKRKHNFGFTMKIQATFEYIPGQYFDFYGDDDVWVFINNKLVVDIGGQHTQVAGAVNLDTLGLAPGQTYNFHIFYAERHTSSSNFRMRTSIDLKTEARIYLSKPDNETADVLTREVMQRVRKNRLACDFSSTGAEVINEKAKSSFVLFGGNLPAEGVSLNEAKTWYGGITIANTFDKFSIDKNAIKDARSLVPGIYNLRVILQSDPSQYQDVYFVVDAYQLPNLVFTKANGDTIGSNVNSSDYQLNLTKDTMWVGQSYKVYVQYAEDWATTNDIITPQTKDPFVFCDSLGNPITEVQLNEGKGSFYVRATDEILNGTLAVKGQAAGNTAYWRGIVIYKPPVPQIVEARIFDQNGDGSADYIWMLFDDKLGIKNTLDAATFTFGDIPDESSYVPVYNVGSSEAYIVPKNGAKNFRNEIFTGKNQKINNQPYSGQIKAQLTYTENKTSFTMEGLLTDNIGPVIQKADIEYMRDGNAQLTLTFSEGVESDFINSSLFQFHCWKDGVLNYSVKPAGGNVLAPNQWVLVFPNGSRADVIPAVGDSVRFMPPSQGDTVRDLANIGPHENNPWVRVTGEQRVTITSPDVVKLDKDSDNFLNAVEIIRSPEATVTKVAPSSVMNADQAAATYGTQGHFLGDLDMAELVQNKIEDIKDAVRNTPSYEDHYAPLNADGTPQKKYLKDIIEEVHLGQISIRDAQKRYWLDPTIVDAYESGLLTVENLPFYESGSESDIQMIVESVAQTTELSYKTSYYSALGEYVNGSTGAISCTSDIYKGTNGHGTCLDNDGKIFLAWNMRAKNGRLVSTGVYIARLEYRIKVGNKNLVKRTQDFLWGYRRGKVSAIEIGLE